MRLAVLLCLWMTFFCGVVNAAPAPEEFGKRELVHDAAISPDGTRIAVFQNFEGTYGVRVINLDAPSEEPKVAVMGDHIKPGWITWANNDRVLASIWDNQKIGGTPVTTGFLYTLDPEDMDGRILVRPRGIIRQYNNRVVDMLRDDEDNILMSFSDTNVGAPDVKRVNVKTGSYRTVRRGRADIQSWYSDLRGEVRVGQGRKGSGAEVQWTTMIRRADEDKWDFDHEFPGLAADVDIFGFTSDPNELIIGDYADKDTLGIYVYDLEEKKITRKLFHDDVYDAQGVVLNGDRTEVVGASYTADSEEIRLFEEYEGAVDFARSQYPGFDVDYVDQSADGQRSLVYLSASTEAGALMLVDAETEEISRLAMLRPGLPASEMGAVSAVRYTARDGEKIPAYVMLPPTITDPSQLENLPFIILPHGGPYGRADMHFDYFGQFFATRGYGVLEMNFRGSSGYGKSFMDAGRSNWVIMQEDVEDGARWLVEKGYADPDRMCIAGWSYGGYAALMGAVKNSDLYQCAISIAGVTDLENLIRDMKAYTFGRSSAENFVRSGFEDKDHMRENSPERRAEEIEIPVFMAHGEDDQRVHFDHFKKMKDELEDAGADAVFLSFDDEDHFMSNQKNRIEMFKQIDAFLERHMGESEFKK